MTKSFYHTLDTVSGHCRRGEGRAGGDSCTEKHGAAAAGEVFCTFARATWSCSRSVSLLAFCLLSETRRVGRRRLMDDTCKVDR